MTGAPHSAALPLISWLIREGLGLRTVGDVVGGLADRLRDEGIAIERIGLWHTTLHPLFRSEGHVWTPEAGLELESFVHDGVTERPDWRASPLLAAVLGQKRRMRRQLTGPGALIDYPVLETFRQRGFTDYFVGTERFDSFFRPPRASEAGLIPHHAGMVVSYTTRRATGFSDAEIELFDALLDPLAVLVKVVSQTQIAHTLARCYIGGRAGPRVLGGDIVLGDVAATEAVVWFCDMRGSTRLAGQLSPATYVELINRFLGATIGAVVSEGGEPLTLMGDGALAIFPVDDLGEAGARAAALRAADRAEERLAALNTERAARSEAPLGWGIALHAGAVEYGNIGVPERQSWTALGPVVNEAARLESLTKDLEVPLLASAAFAEGLDPPWRPLGSHLLTGVPEPMAVFARPQV